VSPRAFLDVVAKRGIPCLCRESKTGHIIHSLVTTLTELHYSIIKYGWLRFINNPHEICIVARNVKQSIQIYWKGQNL
jgi:hypothetical protein